MSNIRVLAANPGLPISNPVSTAVHAIEPDLPIGFIDPASVPDLYAMVCSGTCMEPIIPDGARVWADKTQPIEVGDLVFVYLRPEAVEPGGLPIRLKRLLVAPPSWVTFPWADNPRSEVLPVVIFGMDNPRASLSLRCSQILAIHKCMGLVPAWGKNASGRRRNASRGLWPRAAPRAAGAEGSSKAAVGARLTQRAACKCSSPER